MNLYNTIKAEAVKIYGSEEAADEFMNGFVVKAASFWDNFNLNAPTAAPKDSRFQATFGEHISKGMGESLGRAAAGGAASLAIAGISSVAGVIKDHALYNKFLKALNEAVHSNKILKGEDKTKVINFANTVFKFAPNVATDPNLLASILANAIHGENIDPMTIKTLTELESRYKELGNFQPKQWI